MDEQTTLGPNPFPPNPVAGDTIEHLPDYRGTASYQEALKRLEIFREQFFRDGDGMAVGIRGTFGCGKTHLILQLLDHLSAVKSPPFKHILTVVEQADFRKLYVDHFARKVEADGLREVYSLHYAKLLRGRAPGADGGDGAAESAGPKTLAQIAREEVDRLASDNPQGILKLITQDLLPVKDLHGKLDADIAGLKETSKSLASDFFLVYSKLTDPGGGGLALRWIQGETLSDSERRTLGLETRGIGSADDAKNALRFLLGAFRKAGYAVLFCVDEFERFALRQSPDEQRASSGLIKDLAEIFKSTGHFLIVSGVADAWNKMPEDMFHRIKRPDIIQVQLSEDEAVAVLKAYARREVAEIFDEGAVELLFEVSELNARRLLTLAYYAYEAAEESDEPRLVSRADIRKATNKVLSDSTRVDNAGQVIRGVADSLGMSYRAGGELSGVRYDFLLGDPEGRQVIVEVRRSLFKLGEIEHARTVASSSRALKKDYPRARFCIVVVGYSTPEVRNELGKVVDRVFYYDEEKFAGEFREFVSSNVLAAAEGAPASAPGEGVYKDLDERFDQLEKTRQAELEQIKLELERLRAETARTAEAERERRVTDKMTVPLAELKSLLRQEEELGLRGKSAPLAVRGAEEKYAEALELLDRQKAAINEAEILNEKLLYEKEFSRELHTLAALADTAEEVWTAALQLSRKSTMTFPALFLDDYYELSPLRELFRQRRQVLSVLEATHARRVSEADLGIYPQALRAVRRLSLPVLALLALSVAGVLFFVLSMSNAWSVEKANRDRHVASLNSIQKVAQQIALEANLPGTVRGAELGRSLIEAVSVLVPSGDAGGSRPQSDHVIKDQITDITELASKINAELSADFSGQTARPSLFPLQFHEARLQNYQAAANLIKYNCNSGLSNLSEVSFDTFFLRYVSRPLSLAPLLPLALLVAYFFRRRVRERQPRNHITAEQIKLKEGRA